MGWKMHYEGHAKSEKPNRTKELRDENRYSLKANQ